MPKSSQCCVISRARRTVVDYIGADGRTVYGRKLMGEVLAEYPDAEVLPVPEGLHAIEVLFVTPIAEIDEETFWNMLEVLPPVGWRRDSAGESFKMSERTYGSITGIYARVGRRFFAFQDSNTLTHGEIVRKCEAFLAS